MQLAKVIGSVVSTQKDPLIQNLKMLLIEKIDPKSLSGKNDYLVAIDAIGAGIGEVILFAAGSSARMTEITTDKPCDCVIMAIVDQYDIDGETVFQKDL